MQSSQVMVVFCSDIKILEKISNQYHLVLFITLVQISNSLQSRSFVNRLFNITSPWGIAWVLVGLLGQALFTGRMIIQWLASERLGRSTIPVAFWWCSLIGASMLLAYFIWRKDIVGVLGQGLGWFIYIRNLSLIYRGGNRNEIDPKSDPDPEPSLEGGGR